MKKQNALKAAFAIALSIVCLNTTAAWADPCTDAIVSATKALADKGGVCKQLSGQFKSAALSANNACKRVRDKYRACWNTYRSDEKKCDSLKRPRERIACRNKARSKRRSCKDRVQRSTDRAICSDKRRFAAKCFGKTTGACAGPVLGAAGTCVAYWFGVFVKAAAGGYHPQPVNDQAEKQRTL